MRQPPYVSRNASLMQFEWAQEFEGRKLHRSSCNPIQIMCWRIIIISFTIVFPCAGILRKPWRHNWQLNRLPKPLFSQMDGDARPVHFDVRIWSDPHCLIPRSCSWWLANVSVLEHAGLMLTWEEGAGVDVGIGAPTWRSTPHPMARPMPRLLLLLQIIPVFHSSVHQDHNWNRLGIFPWSENLLACERNHSAEVDLWDILEGMKTESWSDPCWFVRSSVPLVYPIVLLPWSNIIIWICHLPRIYCRRWDSPAPPSVHTLRILLA